MSKRTYNFPLPVTVPGWKLRMGLGQYKGDPVYQSLPRNLRTALEQGEATGQDVQIRESDLNRLPDATWAYIQRTLGL